MAEVTNHPYRDFEHTGWERAAEAYADTFEVATALFAPALLNAAGVRDGIEMLDVACGTGFVAAAAAARGAKAVGVDFSNAMLAEAAQRHPALVFEHADAESLPFDASRFDAVVINFGVHHFPFPQRALAEGRRVLRHGGRLAFTVWASPADHALHRIVIEAMRAAGNAGAALPAPPLGNVNEHATCLQLLQASGFDTPAPRAWTEHAKLSLAGVPELVHMLRDGTVRMSALIRSLPPERAGAILAEIEKASAPYQQSGGGLQIPVAAILAEAIKG